MPRLRNAVGERDHVRGPAKASVTLVEYGDFECPFCGHAYWVLNRLEERFARDLRFVFRHFPMIEIHPLAMLAAEASEAAAAQGKFWDMHEVLYENQPHFDPENLIEYANEIEIDVDRFIDDLENHRYRERIRDDFMGGVRSGVNGTPCLFINGERFDGPADEALLAKTIEAARRGAFAAAR